MRKTILGGLAALAASSFACHGARLEEGARYTPIIDYTFKANDLVTAAAEESGWEDINVINSAYYGTNICEERVPQRIVGTDSQGLESSALLCCSTDSCGFHHFSERPYAVIVVDMQDRFLAGIDPEELEREIPNQLSVIEFAQRRNIPVYVLEFAGFGPTTEVLASKILEGDYEALIKFHDDGFAVTSLNEVLAGRGVQHLVLMGVNASACVLRTAQGAVSRDYEVITSPSIIEDVAYFDNMNESADWYKQNGLWFGTAEELIEYLDGQVD